MNMNNWLIKPAWHIWSSDKKRCSSITIAWNFKTITFSQLNTKKKPATNWNHQATGSNQPWSGRVKSGKKQCKSSSIWTNEYRRIKKKFNQLRKKAPHQNLYNLFHFLFLSRLVCLRAHSAARLQATPAQCSQQCVCVCCNMVLWYYKMEQDGSFRLFHPEYCTEFGIVAHAFVPTSWDLCCRFCEFCPHIHTKHTNEWY